MSGPQAEMKIQNKLDQPVTKRASGIPYAFGPCAAMSVPVDHAVFFLAEYPGIFKKADDDVVLAGKHRVRFISRTRRFSESEPFRCRRDSIRRSFVPGDVVWMNGGELEWFREKMNRYGCDLEPVKPSRIDDPAALAVGRDSCEEVEVETEPEKMNGLQKWQAVRKAARTELGLDVPQRAGRDQLLPMMFMADAEQAARILERYGVAYSEGETAFAPLEE